MANRVLTWHHSSEVSIGSEVRIGPAYYLEGNFVPVAVRLETEVAPTSDAEFNIFDDGVSIFEDSGSTRKNITTGVIISTSVNRNIPLYTGETRELDAEDFKSGLSIAKGSWVTCKCIQSGGSKNFSVHLELDSMDED